MNMVLIDDPFEFTDRDIASIESKFKEPEDWDRKFYALKQRIKAYLLKEQNRICPYCYMRLMRGNSYLTIDHIVPKSLHKKFTFTPENLAVACRVCNTKKQDDETLCDDRVTEYPSESAAFTIIHPYYDEYHEHIEFQDDLFVQGISDKGKETIIMCKLIRMDLIEDRAYLLRLDDRTLLMRLILRLAREGDRTLLPLIQDQITALY